MCFIHKGLANTRTGLAAAHVITLSTLCFHVFILPQQLMSDGDGLTDRSMDDVRVNEQVVK